MDINELSVSRRTVSAFASNSIHTLDQLRRYELKTLLAMPNIGTATVLELALALWLLPETLKYAQDYDSWKMDHEERYRLRCKAEAFDAVAEVIDARRKEMSQ